MSKGINVRCTQGELVFDAFLQDAAGNLVNSGTTYFRLYRRIEPSALLQSFDWNDANFKQSALTTENLSASHVKGNNNTRDTGLWMNRLSSLQNFNKGDICYLQVDNTYASPKIQTTKFQFGSAEGDMDVNDSGFIDANVNSWRDSIPAILNSSRLNVYVEDMAADVINSNAISSAAVTEIQSGLAKGSDIISISGLLGGGSTNVNITGWLGMPPAALVLGRVNSYVEDMSSPVVSSIQSGLATSSQINSISGKLDNLSVNVSGWRGSQPNNIFNGRVDSYVGEIGTNILNATALSSDAVAEINSGMPTLSDILSLSGLFNNLSVNVSGWRGSQPAVLNSSRVNVYVEDMAANVVNASALATDAVTEIQNGLARQSDIISISGLLGSSSSNVNITGWMGLRPNSLLNGRVDSYVGAYAPNMFPLQPSVTGRYLNVTLSGRAGINWGDIEDNLARVYLSNTSISGFTNFTSGTINANVVQWSGSNVSPLVSGRVDSYVGAYASGQIPLQPTLDGRKLDVNANGEAGIDWGNIGNQTSSVNLVNTSISGINQTISSSSNVNVTGWLGLPPNSLNTGRVDVYVGAMGTDTLTSAALASSAVTEIQTGLVTSAQLESVSGRFNLINANISGWLGLTPNSLKNGRVDGYVGSYGPNLMPLQPSITGRYLDVTTLGQVGSTGDFSNLSVNVSGWRGLQPNSLTAGRVDSIVGNYAATMFPLQPQVEGRKLDVTTSGTTAINWGNIENKNYVANLTNTSISGMSQSVTSSSSVNVTGWLGLPPNVLNNGRVDVYVGSMGTNTLTSTALDSSAVTEIQTGLATNSDILSVSGKLNNLSVNISGWRGLQPNVLISGKVDSYTDASAISSVVNANVVSWSGYNILPTISGLIQSYVGGYHEMETPVKPVTLGRRLDISDSGYVGVFANYDKQGYYLHASGLESISVTIPSGAATTFREMNIQLWRRFFKKTVLSASGGIVTYQDDGTTPITVQAVSDDGVYQIQGSS